MGKFGCNQLSLSKESCCAIQNKKENNIKQELACIKPSGVGKQCFSKMAAKQLHRRRPFPIVFEPVHPSTLCEDLVCDPSGHFKDRVLANIKKTDAVQNNTFWKIFFWVVITVISLR